MLQEEGVRERRKSILLVDDLVTNIKLLARYLHEYKLYFALDGDTALAVAEENQPDMILLDIMMPDIDGYELCRLFKENPRTKKIPVIFVTAKNNQDDEELGLQVGAIDFITKPVNGAILRARIANNLELKEHRDNLAGLLAAKSKELDGTYEQLLHAEKLSSLGKLSSSISHEFASPLFGMEQILTTFHDEEPAADKKHMLAVCIGECQRLRELIRSLHNLGRPTSSHRGPTDLNQIISDVLHLCAKTFEKKNILIEKNLQQIPLVQAIEDQMKQVVFNLIFNACDAMAEGGGRFFIATSVAQEQIVLTVTDNGCGIAPADMQAVFAPFFTTKQQAGGTGLGLSICYGIVTTHKGTIEVHSTPGVGSTFTVRIPALEAK
ncbi:MAG: ATP-binding protein [Desulfurivibrionaceae bacterium]|nr:ATP-binding protein [Desulfurivibrionaceae bacterium]